MATSKRFHVLLAPCTFSSARSALSQFLFSLSFDFTQTKFETWQRPWNFKGFYSDGLAATRQTKIQLTNCVLFKHHRAHVPLLSKSWDSFLIGRMYFLFIVFSFFVCIYLFIFLFFDKIFFPCSHWSQLTSRRTGSHLVSHALLFGWGLSGYFIYVSTDNYSNCMSLLRDLWYTN